MKPRNSSSIAGNWAKMRPATCAMGHAARGCALIPTSASSARRSAIEYSVKWRFGADVSCMCSLSNSLKPRVQSWMRFQVAEIWPTLVLRDFLTFSLKSFWLASCLKFWMSPSTSCSLATSCWQCSLWPPHGAAEAACLAAIAASGAPAARSVRGVAGLAAGCEIAELPTVGRAAAADCPALAGADAPAILSTGDAGIKVAATALTASAPICEALDAETAGGATLAAFLGATLP
mmetsp:Transcript_106033/g.295062  ORF Transcript_106033/g.295062 Transcript_106033/m.295062 type:complete len:234 (-) Transcript_106033:240-941(-)